MRHPRRGVLRVGGKQLFTKLMSGKVALTHYPGDRPHRRQNGAERGETNQHTTCMDTQSIDSPDLLSTSLTPTKGQLKLCSARPEERSTYVMVDYMTPNSVDIS
ncbi:hypothetical protein M404DRAFT_877547 [Pisolithus tinctorius Marx 270]|uniref:Uncharacterized protein n=1 Tax=Pisolithus tinctorius Marx 270 TaxID=870435 RepID=A0A0C3KMM5_PISTI|nr:hypothetical protein M404DRAFT_877547 [Pisolithus tinctorius Marx 270]